MNYLLCVPCFVALSRAARDVCWSVIYSLWINLHEESCLRAACSNHIMSADNLCRYNYLDRRLLGGEASVPTWRKSKMHIRQSHHLTMKHNNIIIMKTLCFLTIAAIRVCIRVLLFNNVFVWLEQWVEGMTEEGKPGQSTLRPRINPPATDLLSLHHDGCSEGILLYVTLKLSWLCQSSLRTAAAALSEQLLNEKQFLRCTNVL